MKTISETGSCCVQGDELDLGLRTEHYRIDIGQGQCRDVDLKTNVLTCRPPKKQPKLVKSGNYKKNAPRIFVSMQPKNL